MNYNSDNINEAIVGDDPTKVKGQPYLQNVQYFTSTSAGNTINVTPQGVVISGSGGTSIGVGPSGTTGVDSTPSSIVGGKIVVTVTATGSRMTVALKNFDGSNPSSSKPLYVNMNGKSLKITAPITLARNSGTNWIGCANTGGSSDLFLYIVQTSVLRLGLGRFGNRVTTAEFVDSQTAFGGLAWDGGSTIFDYNCACVGRITGGVGGAGLKWSAVSETDIVNRPVDFSGFGSSGINYLFNGYSSPPAVASAYMINGNFVDMWCNTVFDGESDSNVNEVVIPIQMNVGNPGYEITSSLGAIRAGEAVATSGLNTFVCPYTVSIEAGLTVMKFFYPVGTNDWSLTGWPSSSAKSVSFRLRVMM